MSALAIFNAVMFLLIAAALAGAIPRRLYDGFLRGLHLTIGITTPTDQQLRRALAIWLISVLAIVDVLAAVIQYL
jgi:hypothetical protein